MPFWKTILPIARSLCRKGASWGRSRRLTRPRRSIGIDAAARDTIAAELDAGVERAFPTMHQRGKARQAEIARETEARNRNNVTRTQAYWELYQAYPELHWALLAHLVSRNGGWAMTDLKGEWLPRMLGEAGCRHHFELLERCNALIFRDAYPQLRLYAVSRRIGAPQFELLPAFGVSAFMRPVWERFWQGRGTASALLTLALIVNEQHVIQRPVVENPYFRARVFERWEFRSLPYLQTNQVVFPLAGVKADRGVRLLAGRVLERFQSLEERIAFGKCLYAMLYGYPKVWTGAVAFAKRVPHTGTRADYWPERFRSRLTQTGGGPRERDPAAGGRWYSPKLEDAWPDRPLPQEPLPDWFAAFPGAAAYLQSPRLPRVVDMTAEHLLGQRKLQAAAAAALAMRDR